MTARNFVCAPAVSFTLVLYRYLALLLFHGLKLLELLLDVVLLLRNPFDLHVKHILYVLVKNHIIVI